MVYEIREKGFRQKTLDFIHDVGYKTIGAYATMVILLIAISVTFLLTQKTQDIRQEASSRKSRNVGSYLSRLRKLTPTLTPIPRITEISPTITQETPVPTSIELQKLGDTNNDGEINIQDLSYLLSHWNKNDAPVADFNNDGIINMSDLSMLLSNWGK